MNLNATERVQCLSYISNVAEVLYTHRSQKIVTNMCFLLEIKAYFCVCASVRVCVYQYISVNQRMYVNELPCTQLHIHCHRELEWLCRQSSSP